jgi:hypothetical protein
LGVFSDLVPTPSTSILETSDLEEKLGEASKQEEEASK